MVYKLKSMARGVCVPTPSEEMSRALLTMLSSYRVAAGSGKPKSHTSLGSPRGVYNLPTEAEEEALLETYSAALAAAPNAAYHLTEMPIASRLPLLVDLDLRRPDSVRCYTDESVEVFLSLYTSCARRLVRLPPKVDWYVLEKPSPRPNPKKLGEFKDGVHLIAPSVVTDAKVQLEVRAEFLSASPDFFKACSSSAGTDVYDEAVLGRNPWFLLGSRKEDEKHAWRVTRIVNVCTQTLECTTLPDPIPPQSSLVTALSIRAAGRRTAPAELTSEGAEALRDAASPPSLHPSVASTAPDTKVRSSSPDGEEVRDARELLALLDARRAEDYNHWIRVGWCLHNISSIRMLPDWIAFSKRCPSKFVAGECEREWTRMRAGLGIGSLHMWAREDDPQAYKAFVGSHLHAELVACDGSHNSVACLSHKILGRRFVCGSGDGKCWYFFDGALWKEDNGCVHLRHELSTTVREQFTMAMHRVSNALSAYDMQSDASATSAARNSKTSCEKLSNIAFNLRNKSFKDAVLVEMREYFYDGAFMDSLDANPGMVAFTNGVWDLREKAFRPATPEDRLSLSVGYDFVLDRDTELYAKMQRYWEQLHPAKDSRDYVLKTLARQLYGDVGANLFHVHAGRCGSAGNGKSTLWEVMEVSCGDYVRKFDVSHLTAKQRPEMGKPQPVFGTWRGRRILYCAEPNDDEAIHSGILKDMTGGECMQYRLLYCNQIFRFRPQYKVHMMCNDAPPFQGGDKGNQRRFRKIDYESRFVGAEEVDEAAHHYLRDDAFIQGIRDSPAVRMEFLRVLLDAYDHGYAFKMPKTVEEDSRRYVEENDKVLLFVHHCVKKEAGGLMTLKDARVAFSLSEHNNGKPGALKKELEKVLGVPCRDQVKRNGVNHKNVYEGFVLDMDMEEIGEFE